MRENFLHGEQLHEGHRQRMLKRVDNGDPLYDHEILEILLYSVSPRVNTNPIAHRLLDRFCSISGVLKAEVEELKSVEGVGEKIARHLKTVGLCADRAGSIEGAAVLKNFGDCKRFTSMRMRGKSDEVLELYFLEKNGLVRRIYSYTSSDRNKVTANADELIKNISLVRPYGILAAHNHLNGSKQPSANDDIFTAQIQLICSMNNVLLWDHLIYSDGEIYSYSNDGKLTEVARKYSFRNAMKWINDIN